MSQKNSGTEITILAYTSGSPAALAPPSSRQCFSPLWDTPNEPDVHLGSGVPYVSLGKRISHNEAHFFPPSLSLSRLPSFPEIYIIARARAARHACISPIYIIVGAGVTQYFNKAQPPASARLTDYVWAARGREMERMRHRHRLMYGQSAALMHRVLPELPLPPI